MGELYDEPAEVYHAQRLRHMTSHRLIKAREGVDEFVRDTRDPGPDTVAYGFGRACHAYILEGEEAFHQQYIVGGPTNPRTGKTYGRTSKRWAEAAAGYRLELVSPEELVRIRSMAKVVLANRAAAKLLAEGAPERVGRCEMAGLPAQFRLDWHRPGKWIVDLKTCADLGNIAVDSERYAYATQQAFYREGCRLVTGELLPVFIIWVSKGEPGCVTWRLDPARLDEECELSEACLQDGALREAFHNLQGEQDGGR